MQFRKVTVVGVGLIGGSFALAVRRAGIAERVTGWDRKDVLDRALALDVIDGVDDAFDSARVSDADLLYLAAPVGAIISFLRINGKLLKSGAIITDAGSTKREICRVAREELPSEVAFVGGHPMAGSERTGVEFADAELFRGAPYALVADENENSGAVRAVTDVVSGIGGTPIALTASDHDRVVARVSHAPQLLATALACAVARRRNEADLRLAGNGFSEMVRLAASRWSVWEDICRTNADEIAAALDEVIGEMEATRSSITSGDFDSVGAAFDEANSIADRS